MLRAIAKVEKPPEFFGYVKLSVSFLGGYYKDHLALIFSIIGREQIMELFLKHLQIVSFRALVVRCDPSQEVGCVSPTSVTVSRRAAWDNQLIKKEGLLHLTGLEIPVQGQFPHSFQACVEERHNGTLWWAWWLTSARNWESEEVGSYCCPSRAHSQHLEGLLLGSTF